MTTLWPRALCALILLVTARPVEVGAQAGQPAAAAPLAEIVVYYGVSEG